MPVRMPGDLECTGLRNRIIHGLEQSEIFDNGVVPGTVNVVVVADWRADGHRRDFIILNPRLRYGEIAFGMQYLAGLPRTVRSLAVSSLPERLAAG